VTKRQEISAHIFKRAALQCRHGLAMKILSVRLPIKRVDCDKTEQRSVQIFIHTKDHLAERHGVTHNISSEAENSSISASKN